MSMRTHQAGDPFGRSYANRYMNWRRADTIVRFIERACARHDGPPLRLLEIGCGSGGLLFQLDERCGGHVRATGIDLGPQGIAAAQDRALAEGRTRLTFSVMDANALSFPEASFDIIIASEVLEHLARPAEVLSAIRRISAPGARGICTVPNSARPALRLLRALAPLLPGERERRARRDNAHRGASGTREEGIGHGHVSALPRSAWSALFRAAGLPPRAVYGTGGMVFGDPSVDERPFLFGMMVMADALLRDTAAGALWSETLVMEWERPS